MSTWAPQEFDFLACVNELRVAGRRQDGAFRTPTTVWHVAVEGALYFRSVYGPNGRWYKGVIHHHEGLVSWRGSPRPVIYVPGHTNDTAIGAAYFDKYGRGAPSQPITCADAKTTTPRIEPR